MRRIDVAPRRSRGQSSTEVMLVTLAFVATLVWLPDGPLDRLVRGVDQYLQRYTLAVSRP